jgi:hypothetical protein
MATLLKRSSAGFRDAVQLPELQTTRAHMAFQRARCIDWIYASEGSVRRGMYSIRFGVQTTILFRLHCPNKVPPTALLSYETVLNHADYTTQITQEHAHRVCCSHFRNGRGHSAGSS